jgi:hypothetical protein
MNPIALAACSLAVASLAHAQTDPAILFSSPHGWRTNPIGTAIANLGLQEETTLAFADEAPLLAALRSQEWDLVIIRWFDTFEGDDGAATIDELAAHVDRGGKLMFSMARLDEQPELWPVLGITQVWELSVPLEDILPTFGATDPTKRHPAFRSRRSAVADDLPPTTDYGDHLVPDLQSFAVARFVGGSAAIVVSQNGHVIVTGAHWDYWELGYFVAENQLLWLLDCPADLDVDGDLTLFDFFEFQNRFDSGGAVGFADFSYDGRLDVFDFLEFLSLFDAGC